MSTDRLDSRSAFRKEAPTRAARKKFASQVMAYEVLCENRLASFGVFALMAAQRLNPISQLKGQAHSSATHQSP